MMGWNSLALFFLVTVVTATDPSLFLRLCSEGECPPGWRNIDGDCAMFVSGWDRAAAREVCRKEMAEYTEYDLAGAGSAKLHSVPVCLVRRETQCECGRRNKETKIVEGVRAERNEFTWQGMNYSFMKFVLTFF